MAAWSLNSTDGALTGDTVTVAGTATLVVAADATRKELILINASANAMYFGGAGVTTANGPPIPQNGALKLTAATGAKGAWYAIYSGGGGDCRYVEVR